VERCLSNQLRWCLASAIAQHTKRAFEKYRDVILERLGLYKLG
jgi:hypothetical protein